MREKAKRLTLALFNIDEIYLLHERRKRVSEAELCLMYALDDGNPHSQKSIAKKWSIPQTTVNTIIKIWEKKGYLIQTPIPGKRREKQIILTDSGKAYAKEILGFIYSAEDKAVKKTLEKYSDEFIEVIEYFGDCLREAFYDNACD